MSELTDFELLFDAAKNGFQALFKEHNEKFYYCTLILSEGGTPFISAFSEESLKVATQNNAKKYSPETLKWSYADSPYCGYGFEEYFLLLDKVFSERINNTTSDAEYDEVINYWLSLMEKVMEALDKKNIFGEGKKETI